MAQQQKLSSISSLLKVIIAPEISDEAIAAVAEKKNVRLLRTGNWSDAARSLDFKRVNGGLLVQDRDDGMIAREDLTVVTERQPTDRSGVTCCSHGKLPNSSNRTPLFTRQTVEQLVSGRVKCHA